MRTTKLTFGLCAVIFVCYATFGSATAQPKSDIEKQGLRGPVRSVKSQTNDAADERPGAKGRVKQLDTVTYDQNGNEIERIIYDDYGFLVGKETHSHDAKGLLTESVLTDPKGTVMEKRNYRYDGDKLTQIVISDGKGKPIVKQVNSYDVNGRRQKESYFDQSKLAGTTVYEYDQKGNTAQVSFHLANGSKAEAPIGPCLGAHRVVYEYNNERKLTKVIAFESDGKEKKSWTYRYNAAGDVAEDFRESFWSTTKFSYVYEYDSHGNWVKQIAAVDDRSKTFDDSTSTIRKTEIVREITYY